MRTVSGLEFVGSTATAAVLSMAGSVALGEENAADPRFAVKVAQTDPELGRPGSGGSSASRAARELVMVASVTVTLAWLVLHNSSLTYAPTPVDFRQPIRDNPPQTITPARNRTWKSLGKISPNTLRTCPTRNYYNVFGAGR